MNDRDHRDELSQEHKPGQNSQPDSDEITFPPTHARLYRVAAGLAEWTPEEHAWLKQNPKWQRFEQEMRDALNGQRNNSTDSPRKFTERVDRDPEEFDPPSRA